MNKGYGKPEPRWVGDTLVVECSRCVSLGRAGANYEDGSGVCKCCNGAMWIVLDRRPPVEEKQPDE